METALASPDVFSKDHMEIKSRELTRNNLQIHILRETPKADVLLLHNTIQLH